MNKVNRFNNHSKSTSGQRPPVFQSRDCPTASQLKTFASGEFSIEDATIEAVVAHLQTCNTCLANLAKIRDDSGADSRLAKVGVIKAAVLVTLALLILAVTFFGLFHRRR
jgi:hypothetical protein